MSSHLVLFAQVPINQDFHFGDNPKRTLRKISDSQAAVHGQRSIITINPGVLVFPVPNPIVIAEFILRDLTKYLVVRHVDGKWGLYSKTSEPTVIFNNLEDVINHLGV